MLSVLQSFTSRGALLLWGTKPHRKENMDEGSKGIWGLYYFKFDNWKTNV